MAKFSERYGYTKVSDVIIREEVPMRIVNALCDLLHYKISDYIDRCFVTDFLGQRYETSENLFASMELGFKESKVEEFLLAKKVLWYHKLDALEYILPLFCADLKDKGIRSYRKKYKEIVEEINYIFEKNNFAYRILEDRITEITSNEEIREVEESLTNPLAGVRMHIDTALKFISSAQKEPDYRNSIKESISAVEVCCRAITGENDLGKALSKLEAKGVVINSQMKQGFENLYRYTNDKKTGIRHALMDDANAPTADEAIFMLVSCSAFINYLTKKSQ